MLIKTEKGFFEIKKNYHNAFDAAAFESKYIEECFDSCSYLVGDISSGILRLKGFNDDVKSKSYHGFIDSYIEDSCAFRCPYYVLKRIKDEATFLKLQEEKKNQKEVIEEEEPHFTMQKVPFDKESLVLESVPAVKANIVIDSQKINAIPKGVGNIVLEPLEAPTEEVVTYVSESPDFDVTKIVNNNNNNRNNQRNNNKNKKNNNSNGNQKTTNTNGSQKTNNNNQNKEQKNTNQVNITNTNANLNQKPVNNNQGNKKNNNNRNRYYRNNNNKKNNKTGE